MLLLFHDLFAFREYAGRAGFTNQLSRYMIKLGSLTKNSIYNLLGLGLPMLVGLATIPRLVHVLGVDRFGVLTLTWAVMGYFSLFDLGLGRALTQMVAERSGTGDRGELPDIIRTAVTMMLLLGLVGGLCLSVASPVVVGRVLKMPPALHDEALYAFGLMAFSVPAVTLMAGLRGILEARQRFFEVNILRLSMGILTFFGPWLVSFKTVHLFWLVLSLEAMRYGALVAHYLVCRRTISEMKDGGRFRTPHWRALLRFGGWMTVSNVVSPIMVNMDRFFIGALVSLSAIAYYATPFDMITRLQVVAGSITSVLFPMFGALHRADPAEAKRLYHKGLKTIFVILAPTLLGLGLAAHWFLLHWLGPEFATQSSGVMRVLCLGVVTNSLAFVPFAFIQGVARPDLTAKFHLTEIVLYTVCIWWFGTRFGILGVAWAWTLRVTLDCCLLIYAAHRIQVGPPSENHTYNTIVQIP